MVEPEHENGIVLKWALGLLSEGSYVVFNDDQIICNCKATFHRRIGHNIYDRQEGLTPFLAAYCVPAYVFPTSPLPPLPPLSCLPFETCFDKALKNMVRKLGCHQILYKYIFPSFHLNFWFCLSFWNFQFGRRFLNDAITFINLSLYGFGLGGLINLDKGASRIVGTQLMISNLLGQ